VTTSGERLGARRVLAAPGPGAFAMITSTRSVPDERAEVSLEDFIVVGEFDMLTHSRHHHMGTGRMVSLLEHNTAEAAA
jgi:hypothetical protein